MSTNLVNNAATEPATATDGVPMTAAQYQELAEQLKTVIANVLAAMPPLKQDTTAKPVNVLLGVPREFVVTVTSALKSGKPDEVAPSVFDPAEAENTVAFVDAFGSLVNDTALLARELDLTVKREYASVAQKALNAYAILKRVGRKGTTVLQGQLQLMQQRLGRRGRRPKAVETPQTPQPTQ